MDRNSHDPFKLVAELIRRATDPDRPDAERAAAGRALGGLPMEVLYLLGLDGEWASLLDSLEDPTPAGSSGKPTFPHPWDDDMAEPEEEMPGIVLPRHSRELHVAIQREWDLIEGSTSVPPRALLTPSSLAFRIPGGPDELAFVTSLVESTLGIDPLAPLPDHVRKLLPHRQCLETDETKKSHARLLRSARRTIMNWRSSMVFEEALDPIHFRLRLLVARWVRNTEILDPLAVCHVDLDLVFRFIREASIADVRSIWHSVEGEASRYKEAWQMRAQSNDLLLDHALDILITENPLAHSGVKLSSADAQVLRLLSGIFARWNPRWTQEDREESDLPDDPS